MDDERDSGVRPRRPLPGEQSAGGLLCGEVLGELNAYLDGTLAQEKRAAVEAHVQGCEQCARFGAAYAQVTERVRHITADAPAGQEILDRLRERLLRKMG